MSQHLTANLVVSKADLLAGIDKALGKYKVAALTDKGGQPIYDYVTTSKQVDLDYKPTVLSPKKFFFPPNEVILEYTDEGKITSKIEAEPQILFGIRPCDIHGLQILDEAFAESNGDPNYLAKRENTIIVGIDCHKECDEDAFCYKVNTHHAERGFDVMMYELVGDKYAIQVATDKGKQFVEQYLKTASVDKSALKAYEQKKQAAFGKYKPFKDLDRLPDVFEENKHHEVWKEEADRCFSCGSCIMVCPTCYCFDVVDELALSLKKGERIRRWDACMLSSFAEVAGGENFRKSALARLSHRIGRKFNYLMRKHGQAVCVGCGRCVRACLVDISPKTIVEKITGEVE